MKKYSRILVILLLSMLMIFALLRLGKVEISFDTLARVKWGWLLLAFATFYSGIVVRGTRWRRILTAMGWPVGYVYAQTLLIAGLFISAIIPARLGDVGRVAMLKQDHKIPVAHGLASIAAERALDIFSILILAALGSIWAVQGRIPPRVLQLMIGVIVLLVVGLVGFLVVVRIEQWLRELYWLKTIAPAKMWSLYQHALDFGFSLINGVRSLGKSPVSFGMAVLESLYIWLADALIIYFIFVSIGAPTPWGVTLFSSMTSDLVAAVPLTPAALGQFDAALMGTLSLFGVAIADAGQAIFLTRFVSLWAFIPISGLSTYLFGFSRALNLSQAHIASIQPSATTAVPNPAES